MPFAPLTGPADFLNVLMNADLFSGMYTSQGSGDILVRMCGSWENFVVHLRTFRRIFKPVKQFIMHFMRFGPLKRPADFFKCSSACRSVQWDVH